MMKLRAVCGFAGGQFRRHRLLLCYRETIGSRSASTSPRSTPKRLKHLFYGSLVSALVASGYVYFTDTRASIHRFVVPAILRAVYPDAEDAHRAGISALKELYAMNLHPRERGFFGGSPLAVTVFGYVLDNPIGISGGLDKYGEIPDQLLALGPGIVEIGGVTPLPQDGNPAPRVFRIPSQEALINRYGLPSEGADVMKMRLKQRVREFAYSHQLGLGDGAEQLVLDGYAGVPPGSLTPGRLLAVQIAKNKATPEGDIQAVVDDHVYCVDRIGKYADVIVVNVSSPNTPGLRMLQSKAPLTRILSEVVFAAQKIDRKRKPVVMVKVSPDEDSPLQVQGICDAVWLAGVDGVIVGNTTRSRPTLPKMSAREASLLMEEGGYSSPQLFEKTLSLVRLYRSTLDKGPPEGFAVDKSQFDDGHSPKAIFASGGITNGTQAEQVLEAGASVAMVYTAMVYGGVGTISRIKDELSKHGNGQS